MGDHPRAGAVELGAGPGPQRPEPHFQGVFMPSLRVKRGGLSIKGVVWGDAVGGFGWAFNLSEGTTPSDARLFLCLLGTLETGLED